MLHVAKMYDVCHLQLDVACVCMCACVYIGVVLVHGMVVPSECDSNRTHVSFPPDSTSARSKQYRPAKLAKLSE